MPTLSDVIEQYLVERLAQSASGVIEIQRAELTERFGCVPSQVTYVLMTRFTPERGYLVEARRGGGGGIRITRLDVNRAHVWGILSELDAVDQVRAEHLVRALQQEGLLTGREAAMVVAALHRQVLAMGLPERDLMRARLLKAMLAAALKPEEAEEP